MERRTLSVTRLSRALVTVDVSHRDRVEPVTMRFRNQGDDLVYCTPDDEILRRPDMIDSGDALGGHPRRSLGPQSRWRC